MLALVAVLMAGAARVEAVRERRYPMPEQADEALYLRSGTMLRRLTLAYNALAADVYWIRAVQYYGGTNRILHTEQQSGAAAAAVDPARRRFDLLYPLLDLTTTLDPRFNIAYRFGAIFLAEPYPAGPGRTDLAIALLQKGLRERPDKWEYMQDIGFVYYWWIHDYKTAAAWFDRASKAPNAPTWLRPLAATTLAQGGDRRSSRLMWESILQSAEVDWLRQQAEHRLLQLNALDQIDALQRIVDRFLASPGHPPLDWAALVRARMLPGRPLDPSGTPYVIQDGKVTIAPTSTLFPLPTEPDKIRGSSPS